LCHDLLDEHLRLLESNYSIIVSSASLRDEKAFENNSKQSQQSATAVVAVVRAQTAYIACASAVVVS
jgi:hypothetical protein